MVNQFIVLFLFFTIGQPIKRVYNMNFRKYISIFLLLIATSLIMAATHPGLFLTPKGVKEIRSSLGKYSMFDQSFNELKKIADEALVAEILVPQPKDGGGGYTHEKHKKNYYEMNAAGILFQITKDKRYALFVKDMLYAYAEIYPTLGLHPATKSATPGKIFWQALNEAVWLVHTSMAYDCVYDFMSEKDRKHIETNLFYPICEFLSNGNPENYKVFNKMHNHGTWATAAVGMIGYVMRDKNLTDMALYGSNKDGKTGFIRQLDVLFSPDGYFTEGPYYQRYAIWPFMTFAQVIQNQQPELKIFAYRDGILLKAVDKLLQSSYMGEIFYLNDALTKTFKTQEIVYAVNIAYKNNPKNKSLFDIVRQQGDFIVSDAGIATAKAFYKEKNKPYYMYESLFMRDGQHGTEGGIAIIRNSNTPDATCLTFKATSHGLSHGHYDKLNITLHDNGNAILTDYGAVRFLNIEPKYGGHYTKENYSWGMQTIAHNTVTINEISHFEAKIDVSSEFNPEILYHDFSTKEVQLISALEKNAYPGTAMQRTTAMLNHPVFEFPVVIDVFRVKSPQVNQTIDLPFYYQGHMVSTNFDYQKNTVELKPLGDKNGYQHLWLEAKGKTDKPQASFTWVKGDRFYSITTLTDASSELMMTRTGANDPYFNLRQDPAFMIRQHNAANHTFVSVIEPHGLYDITKEVTIGYRSNIASLKLIVDNESFSVIEVITTNNETILFAVSNQVAKGTIQFDYQGNKYDLTGNYLLKLITK